MNETLTPSPTKRDLLLACAQELFATGGFHATGVDRILDRAGVAKMTLYNNFGSKDQLIVEVIDAASESMVAQMRAWTAASADPFEQIMLLFEGLGTNFENPGRCGCLIQAAAAEFSDPASDVGQAILRHQSSIQVFLQSMTASTECPDPRALAARIGLLLAGAQTAARICRCRQPADDARDAAAILLEDACRRLDLESTK
jgi:AcrR family transcriptional regulator